MMRIETFHNHFWRVFFLSISPEKQWPQIIIKKCLEKVIYVLQGCHMSGEKSSPDPITCSSSHSCQAFFHIFVRFSGDFFSLHMKASAFVNRVCVCVNVYWLLLSTVNGEFNLLVSCTKRFFPALSCLYSTKVKWCLTITNVGILPFFLPQCNPASKCSARRSSVCIYYLFLFHLFLLYYSMGFLCVCLFFFSRMPVFTRWDNIYSYIYLWSQLQRYDCVVWLSRMPLQTLSKLWQLVRKRWASY